MARREDIDTSIWSDPDFMDLGPVAKAVYVWTFTNPRCGMAGIYKVGRRAIELETGWDGELLDQALAELEAARFAFYDGRVMFVRTRVKHLRTTSPSIAKAIHKDLRAVSGHVFCDLWTAENAHESWVFGPLDTPSTPPRGGPDTPSTPPTGGAEGVQGKGMGKGKEGGVGETDALPADLPAALTATATATHNRLTRVAAAKKAKPPTLAATGRVVADFPDHDHQRLAGEFEHYWVHGAGAKVVRKDIVLTYRRRLEHVTPGSGPARQGESLQDLAARATAAHAEAAA